MRGVLIVATVVGAAWVAACGDNTLPVPPTGPQPLVPDPAVIVGCQPGPVAAGATRAKVIACAEELIGGRLAAGRIGDFVLENDRVRMIVRGPGEGYYQHGSYGGGIVDAATVGGEDLIKELQPAVDLAVGAFDELVITEAGDTGAAELVVRGPATSLDIVIAGLGHVPPTVLVEHHYRLAAGATEVELETRVFTAAGAMPGDHDLYDMLFMGARAPAMLMTEGVMTEGTTSSYGLVYPAGAQSPQLVDLGGIRVALGPTISDTAPSMRWLVIGDGSMASVTDRAWALRGAEVGTIRGTTAPGVDVVIARAGVTATIARADASGAFHATVPPGPYTLRAQQVGRDNGVEVDATSVAGTDTTVAVPAGATGGLALAVRDDGGRPIPARVQCERAGYSTRIEWVGATGDTTIALPPGTWRIVVSRGLEYDAVVADPVVIADGADTQLAVSLAHVVDTAGWIALDTHLHSELSTDSTFPVDDRLRAVAAEGVELPISTDHDVVYDYAPVIAELGLEDWLATMHGAEASSIVIGHINGFPLVADPSRTANGAPRWAGRAPGDLFATMHASGPSTIVQVNHPRRGSSSLFDAIDLDPATLSAGRDPTELGLPATTNLADLSFDAVEVANAGSGDDTEEVFADWLALVAAGHPAAATGSSDSHGSGRYAGTARTYVWVGLGADDPATVDTAAVCDAIRARHVTVGTGAFVTAGIVTAAGTSLPGDHVDVTGLAQVRLRVKVQAPAWQATAQIRIFQGTQEIRTIVLDPTDTLPVRHDAIVQLPTPTASTFFVVRVDFAGPGEPVLGDPLPAFTNPVFADITP
jgi:hypothetical protein